MPQKRYKHEEIVAKRREIDVLLSQGRSVAEQRAPAQYTRERKPNCDAGSAQRWLVAARELSGIGLARGSVAVSVMAGVVSWLTTMARGQSHGARRSAVRRGEHVP